MPRIEESSQAALVAWFRVTYPSYKRLLYIIANGENVGPKRMRRLKELGLVPGMTDLCLAVTHPGCPGLYIEMKAPKGVVRQNQKEVHEALASQGYRVIVSYDWDDARREISDYMQFV